MQLYSKIYLEFKLMLKHSWQWLYSAVVYMALSCIAYWLLQGVAPTIWPTAAPIILWLLATTSLLLSLQTGFLFDMQYGAINSWRIRGHNTLQLAYIRLLVSYLLTMLPIAMTSYILSYLLHVTVAQSFTFFALWALASWLMLGLGITISALAPVLRIRSNLLILISIPFYIPILLWGVGAIYHYQLGLNNSFEWYILLGSAILGVVIFPRLLTEAVIIGVDN